MSGPEHRDAPPQEPPSDAELRAALEEELKRITVDDVLVQTVVSLLNLGGRRAGLAPGTEQERDLEQVHTAIEAVRALLPVLEQAAEQPQLGPVRDALAQLQLAYASARGAAEAPSPADSHESAPEESPQGAGPAQSSGRLWVPGSETRRPNR